LPWLVEPMPLVPLSDEAEDEGLLVAELLEELGVLVVAEPAVAPEVAVDVVPEVSADVPVAAELATPATSVAPRAAPAVATPAAVKVARRNARFGRLGGGVDVMSTTIAGGDSSQPQPTVKRTSRSVRWRLNAERGVIPDLSPLTPALAALGCLASRGRPR